MPTLTAEMVDFHLPLPWFLDIDLTNGHMVANSAISEEQVDLADTVASLLGGAVQQFSATVFYPGDRWTAWGTPATRGQLRRFVIRVPEKHLQEVARGARLVAEHVLNAAKVSTRDAVVVTRAGDDTAILF